MPRTDNQKAVTAYLPLDLYDRIADFKISKGLRSDSQAIAVILEQFFHSSFESNQTDSNDVEKQLKTLEQKITFMQVWWKDERDNMLEIMDDLLNRTKFLIPQSVDSNVPSTLESTVDSNVLSTLESTVNSNVLSTLESTVNSNVPSTLESTVNSNVPSTLESTVNSNVPSTLESTVNSNVPSTAEISPLTINSTHPYFERLILCIERDEYLSYWTDGDSFSPDIREAKLYDKQTYLLKQIEKLVERDYDRNWLKFTTARNCIKKDCERYSLQDIFDRWKRLEDRKKKRKSARRKAAIATQ